MLKFLKNQFWLDRSDRRIVLALAAGLGLFIEAVIVGATLYTRDPETVLLASGMVLVFGLFFLGLVFGGKFFIEFNMGLSMGATRLRMLAASFFNCLCLEAALLLVTAALRGLEWGVYTLWLQKSVPGLLARVDFMGAMLRLPWWGWALALAAPLFVGFVSGTLINRFGRTGFWVLWGIFLVGFVLPMNMFSWNHDDAALAAGLAALLPALWWVLGIFVTAVSAGMVWLTLRADVRRD